MCNFECDHCFLHCSPQSQGTFTIHQVSEVLEEAKKIGTVERIFYEGGEPFLFFPLLNESIKRATEKGLNVGVVTNAYGTLAEEDAELWLRPLVESGLRFLNVSNDTFHYGEEKNNPAMVATSVAKKLGIDTSSICIELPQVIEPTAKGDAKGAPVIGGGPKFRGRAVDTLTKGLPLRPWRTLRECPYEDLETPSRLHIDSYGNVQICQGISIGNMWKTPLSDLVTQYRPDAHPICGPLLQGGPAELVKACGIQPQAGYVDECHLCYLARKEMVATFPDYLAPKQVYG